MLRTALKSLRRTPGLALAAIVCLALGATATAAVATLVSALLLRPLPFPEPERLVRVWLAETDGDSRVSLSIPELADFAQARSFDRFLGTARVRLVALLGSGAERLRGEGVSAGYFETLGLQPALGRLFAAEDHRPDSAPVVVLSHGAWTRVYGSDPAVVGRPLRSARAVYTIVGVGPRGFDGTVEDDIVEIWLPIEHYEPRALATNRQGRSAWAIARLAPGVTVAAADAEVAAIGTALETQYPAVYGAYRARVEPMGESWRSGLRTGSGLLLAAAAALLLVAGVNVGCLLLARVLDRRRELAVRASLGADRRRLTLQLFAEAVVIVTLGGIAGAIAGPAVLGTLLTLSPVALPGYVELTPDRWAFTIAFALLAVTALLAGTAPALVGRRVDPADVLRATGRGTMGRAVERRWSALLVGVETALTLVLLVAGTLLFRSFDRLDSTPLGFDRAHIARLAVTLTASDVGGEERLPAIYERLHAEIAAHPGVTEVALVSPTLPPWDGERALITIQGLDLPPDSPGIEVGTHFADHRLLPLLGARIVAGRNLSAADTRAAAPVVVVSEAVARLLGGPVQAIGRTLRFAAAQPRASDVAYRIVGVVENVAYDGLIEQDTRRFVRGGAGADPRAGRGDAYFSLPQLPQTVVSIGASTTAPPTSMIAPLRAIIQRVAPASAVHWTSAMADEIALEYAPSRFHSVLVALFSLSALMLTSVGLFALLSHTASQRMGEMALRVALGAPRRAAVRLLLGTALAPILAGIVVGVAAAAAAARLLQGVLYGIGPFDPASFLLAVAAFLAVAAAAGLLPARRVARVNPNAVLRGD